MSQLPERIVDFPLVDDLDAAIDEAIRQSGGDPRAAVGALILGQRSLQNTLGDGISAGYVRRRLGR